MDLDLTGQAVLASQVQTRINSLKEQMDLRKPVWDRLSEEKKKAWIASGNDPLMTVSWQIYRYLRDEFFTQEVDNG